MVYFQFIKIIMSPIQITFYDFFIWQPIYLFFPYLAPWVSATNKGIHVILPVTWHRYYPKWTAVLFKKKKLTWCKIGKFKFSSAKYKTLVCFSAK